MDFQETLYIDLNSQKIFHNHHDLLLVTQKYP